jgi:hypothetical protein
MSKGLARRKYDDGRHAALRRKLAPVVARGLTRCARGEACFVAEVVNGVRVGGLIRPGEPWDLDHADDGLGYLGPSHRRCNRATAGRQRRTSRRW